MEFIAKEERGQQQERMGAHGDGGLEAMAWVIIGLCMGYSLRQREKEEHGRGERQAGDEGRGVTAMIGKRR